MKWKVVAVFVVLICLGALVLLAPLALRTWVDRRYSDQIYSQADETPSRPVAIVFGAGYTPAGLSSALADRMETAIGLYKSGRVNKLLLTGDNRYVHYNEPEAMAQYALVRGVPRGDLILDYAGRRTYDSCYRAGVIFGVERAILITQAFHLPRALYTCQGLGLDTVGVVADRRRYLRAPWYDLRELAALTRAWLDLNLFRPLPVLGQPVPVDWNDRAEGGAKGG